MGKYSNSKDEIFSIFGSDLWKATGIKTFPSNFTTTSAGTEFIRATVLFSGGGVNFVSIKGMLIVDIFVPTNQGPSRLLTIADLLDTFLQNKSISSVAGSVVQFFQSNLEELGPDKDNTSLYRAKYSIEFHFNKNGV